MSETKTQKQKPTVSNDNHDENIGQRGDVTKTGGTKVHGDDLEGAIPDKPLAGNRPRRDDGDNDDLGELSGPGKGPSR